MEDFEKSKSDLLKELLELKHEYTLLKSLYEEENNIRLQQEKEQRKVNVSLRTLSAAIDQSPFSTVITDLHGAIVFVNPKFIETTGFSYSEVVGKNPRILKGGFTPQSVYENLWTTILAGKSWSGVFSNRRKNGALYWESAVISPVKDEDGNITHFLAIKEDITEKRLSEEQLGVSNANLTAIIENTSENIWSVNTIYEVIYLNTTFAHSFESVYGAELMPGMNILDALPPGISAEWKSHYDKVFCNERIIFEEKFEIGSSSMFVEVAMNPILVEDKVIGASVISRNITQRKQSEAELHKLNSFLDSVIENIPNMVFIKDAKDLSFLRFNLAGERLLGVKREDLIGKNDYDFFEKEQADHFVAYDRKVLESKKLVDIPSEPIKTDKGVRLLHTMKVPILNELGEAISLLGISEDITVRKEAEERLRQSEERYHLLADVTIEGIVIHENGVIKDVNSALLKMFGYQRNEVIDKHVFSFLLEDDLHIGQESLVTRSVIPYEVRCIRKSGEVFFAEVEARNYQDQGEEFRVTAIRDISERKRTQSELDAKNAALVQANADKDRFIAILGHDLRSPFNALLGFSRLLVENLREYDMETIESFCGHINKTAENTYSLLEDILIWATLKTGNAPFQPINLSFDSLCNDVFGSLMPTALTKGITLTCLHSPEATIFADKNMIKTVLRNLVSNALKFTKTGGHIEVTIEQDVKWVTVVVADNGIGIAPEKLANIFDLSKKSSTLGTSNEKGTGLGLILCQEFVEKHCGTIWVESELGVGSKFKFRLPNSY